MKCTIEKRFKLFTVLALCLIVAGLAVFSFFGFGKSAEQSAECVLTVNIDANIGDAEKVVKESAEEYFSNQKIKTVAHASKVSVNGEYYVYTVSDLNGLGMEAVRDNLKSYIEGKLGAVEGLGQLNVKVDVATPTYYVNNSVSGILISAAIIYVATFIYFLFTEKLSGALTVFVSSLISGLLFFALMGLTRIPTESMFGVTLVLSATLSAILSVVIVNRCKELCRNVANDKKSYYKIGEMATAASGVRLAVVLGAIAVITIALVLLGNLQIKLIGLQILISGVSAVFTAYAFSAVVWAYFKSFRKDKKPQLETVNTEA